MTRLQEVIEPRNLERILETFQKSTGMRALVVDRQGFPEVTPKRFCHSHFCNLVQSTRSGAEMCRGSYARAGAESAKFGEPYIFRCHAGLINWAAPILVNGEHVNTIICGQVLMWEPEEFFWIEIAEATGDMEIDFAELMDAAKQLEVISGDRVNAAAELLFIVANHIMRTGALALEQRQKISQQQARLHEEMQARKTLESLLRKQARRKPDANLLEKEEELLSRVRVKDRAGASRVLGEILTEILAVSSAETAAVQARVLELLVLLSRAAIDAGANFKHVLNMNSGYMQEMAQISTIEDLYFFIEKAMEEFIGEASPTKDIKRIDLLEETMDYIRRHYSRSDLTLDSIAQAVFLSPCYLSHLFKKGLGYTITDYLTQVRIEEAKKLLKTTDLSVSEVGERVGYCDPSYFSKIFRRHTHQSPREYKDQFRLYRGGQAYDTAPAGN